MCGLEVGYGGKILIREILGRKSLKSIFCEVLDQKADPHGDDNKKSNNKYAKAKGCARRSLF
jgi:hypothetical protein